MNFFRPATAVIYPLAADENIPREMEEEESTIQNASWLACLPYGPGIPYVHRGVV